MRFVTGFPGFLGSALVERLLARTDGRIDLVVGDVTEPDLGLDPTVYTNENTRPILGTNATPWRFETDVDVLVASAHEHPRKVDARAMV